MRITGETSEALAELFSFEFFRPGRRRVLPDCSILCAISKNWSRRLCPVTYGAGGSTQRSTTELTAQIKHEIGIEAMAH